MDPIGTSPDELLAIVLRWLDGDGLFAELAGRLQTHAEVAQARRARLGGGPAGRRTKGASDGPIGAERRESTREGNA